MMSICCPAKNSNSTEGGNRRDTLITSLLSFLRSEIRQGRIRACRLAEVGRAKMSTSKSSVAPCVHVKMVEFCFSSAVNAFDEAISRACPLTTVALQLPHRPSRQLCSNNTPASIAAESNVCPREIGNLVPSWSEIVAP